jgi:hypothetical protein
MVVGSCWAIWAAVSAICLMVSVTVCINMGLFFWFNF